MDLGVADGAGIIGVAQRVGNRAMKNAIVV
jgi:hypothetical protein